MNLSRRRLVGGLAGFSVLGAPLPARAQAPALSFIFVEADDREPCKRWHSNEGHWWKNSAEFSRVNTVFIRSPRIHQAFTDLYWPPQLRKYRDTPDLQRATPGYIVVRDDQVVLTAVGYTAWRKKVYPALREMVASADGQFKPA